MYTQHFDFNFDLVPPVFKRHRHVLIVLKTPDDKYLLSKKTIYPEGIYRFIGGGIEENEDSYEGIIREVKEELNIGLDFLKVTPIAHITAHLHEVSTKTQFDFDSYLYHCQLPQGQEVTLDDEISEIVYFNESQLINLIENYRHLSTDIFDEKFRWSDYGAVFGPIHQIGLDLTKDL